MRGECPVAGAGAPGTWAPLASPFGNTFTIEFSRFQVYFSFSVRVLRRDSISTDPFGMGDELIYDNSLRQSKMAPSGLLYRHLSPICQDKVYGFFLVPR